MVNGCKRLTDRGLHVVAQCCPELRRLEVAGCYNISNDAVFEVVSRCPNLEHLNLSGKQKSTRNQSHPTLTGVPLSFIKERLLPNITSRTCVALPQRIPLLGPSQSFLLKLVESLEEQEKFCQP